MSMQLTSRPEDDFAPSYMHVESLGNVSACGAVAVRTQAGLATAYAQGNVGGYQVIVISDASSAVAELANMQSVLAMTGGRYPFVLVRAQPARLAGPPLDDFMRSLGCTCVA